jgi:hypothetical protein
MEPFNIRIQNITQGTKKPVNQEVTQNADGSGGPIAIAKQVYTPQQDPKNKKQYKKRLEQYKQDPYQKSVDKFPQFNQETDTIISTTSGNYNLNKTMNLAKAQNAATHLRDGNTSNNYTINNMRGPKDSASYREPDGRTTTYDLHDKEGLRSSVRAVAKKKDACYRKAKAKYDVFPSAYASGYIAKCRKRGGKLG